MAIDIEHLRHFQLEQLEQKNIQTSARIPIHSRTIEWALIEIVILLTGIGDSLKRMADKPYATSLRDSRLMRWRPTIEIMGRCSTYV
jgi:hypothetical protein